MEDSCQQPTLQLVAPLRQMVQSPEGPPEGPHQHLPGQGDPARYKQPLSVEPEGHGPCTPEGSLFPGLACPLSNRQFYLWTSFPGVRWQSHLFWMLWRWELDLQRADALLYFWTQRKQKGQRAYLLYLFPKFLHRPKRSRGLSTNTTLTYSCSVFQWGFMPPVYGPAQDSENPRELQ